MPAFLGPKPGLPNVLLVWGLSNIKKINRRRRIAGVANLIQHLVFLFFSLKLVLRVHIRLKAGVGKVSQFPLASFEV